MSDLETEIFKKLKPLGDSKRAAHDRDYLNTKYDLLGCTMPNIRHVAKEISNSLENIPLTEQRRAFDRIWQSSSSFDTLYVCLIYFQSRKTENDLTDWKILKKWTKKIDNWAHSDVLADIIAQLHERFPAEIYPTLQVWNQSDFSWERRLSLTGLIYYSRARQKPPKSQQVLPLVKNLLFDSDPYVQKAVGWTLRECGNLYPLETQKFIKDNLNSLSASAFSYATEKWSKTKKEPLKDLRKKQRKNLRLNLRLLSNR